MFDIHFDSAVCLTAYAEIDSRSINACVVNSVLRHIGNPCCSKSGGCDQLLQLRSLLRLHTARLCLNSLRPL